MCVYPHVFGEFTPAAPSPGGRGLGSGGRPRRRVDPSGAGVARRGSQETWTVAVDLSSCTPNHRRTQGQPKNGGFIVDMGINDGQYMVSIWLLYGY